MSIHVSSLVWKLNCHHGTKLVLLKLADHAKDDGSDVFPAIPTVARECGCTDRTVQRVVKLAIKIGWLSEEPSPGNRPNRYRFDLNALRSPVESRPRVTECQGDICAEGDIGGKNSVANVTLGCRECHPINKNHQLNIKKIMVEKSDDDTWSVFLATYPKRAGDRGVAKGKLKFASLLKAGEDAAAIIDGVTRYSRYCEAMNKTGTEYVKQIPTFLNSRAWEEDYPLPGNKGSAPTRDASEVRLV